MPFTSKDIEGFSKAVESLKKYRRADLTDEEGKSILDKLYTDLLPEEHILNKCLLDNTTYLVGRKGTGKSTLFLKMENELRKNKKYLPCYIDVKTTYESSQTQKIDSQYLQDYLDYNVIETYLLERTFIQNVLITIQKELEKTYRNQFERTMSKLFNTNKNDAQKKIKELSEKINNNDHLKEIEIPILQEKEVSISNHKIDNKDNELNLNTGNNTVSITGAGIDLSHKNGSFMKRRKQRKNERSINSNFSDVFVKVFEIREIILSIKEILLTLGIKHLVIMLDDLSEIDDNAIITFVDTIIAPLNNWSDEFIKFKIASYPNRIHYGKIDPGKVDKINLDFYNLYSEFDRNKMEQFAHDFTKRLLETRIQYFTGKNVEYFFDVNKSNSMNEYYELLFQASMNVPRIMGYILSYCHQNRIIFNNKIKKNDIEQASEKYFNDKINSFFQSSIYSLSSMNEKISNFQLNELKTLIVNKLLEIKKRIVTDDLKGQVYIKKSPYTSHFHVDPGLDTYLKTLELNHFISKYNELSDKDGNQVDIYCINHGLAMKNNILWGKPKGSDYRKYFIERPFSFTKLIKDFIDNSKRIHCTNPKCGKIFKQEEIMLLEFNHFNCNNCGSKVVIDEIDDEFKEVIKSIERDKLLERKDLNIIIELSTSGENFRYAREIAEELDYSKHTIAFRCKALAENYGLIERVKIRENDPYKYRITEKAKKNYVDKNQNHK